MRIDKIRIDEIIIKMTLFLFIIISVVINTEIFDSIAEYINSLAYYIAFAMIFVCLIILRFQGFPKVWALGVGWFLLIFIQRFAFSLKSSTPFDVQGLPEDIYYAAFAVFFVTKPRISNLIDTSFIVMVIYLVFYVYFSTGSTALAPESAIELQGYIRADGAREARIILANAFAAFVLYYSLIEIVRSLRIIYVIPLLLSLQCIYLAQSRVAIVVIIINSLFIFIPRKFYKPVAYISFILFTIFFLVCFYGLFDKSFNPFFEFSSDDSGWARAIEYDIAREMLWQDPFFGIGIGSKSFYQAYVNASIPYAANDIGAFGVWSHFGIVGLAWYFWATYVCFFPGRQIEMLENRGLVLIMSASMVAQYGFIAPVIFWGSGRYIWALLFYAIYVGQKKLGEDGGYTVPGRSYAHEVGRLAKAGQPG